MDTCSWMYCTDKYAYLQLDMDTLYLDVYTSLLNVDVYNGCVYATAECLYLVNTLYLNVYTS